MVGINTNIAAQNAQANLAAANSTVSSSVSKLSSGNRIIKASDDVAGLAIGTKLQSNVTALQIGLLNANQAGTVLQIADGALKQVGDILSRQKALAVQANSGSLSNTERGFLNQEFTSLTSEIDRIVDNTNFNGITLLNGSISGDAGVKVSGPTTTTTTTPAVAATLRSVTSATVAASQNSISYTTVGTSAIAGTTATGYAAAGNVTVSLAGFGDQTVGSTAGFGTVSVYHFDDNSASTARPNEVILQTTVNNTIYLSENVAASNTAGNIAAQTITFTAQDGSGTSFDVVTGTAATTALATSGSADTYATNLTNALATVSVYQNRRVDPAPGAVAGSLAGIGAHPVTIKSNNFDTVNNTLGTVGEFTVTAGSGAANSISVQINGVTYADSNIISGNTLSSSSTITLVGRNSGGDATNETLTIDLSGLTTPIDLTNSTATANLATALNSYFGVTVNAATAGSAASTSTTGGYSTVGTIAGSNVTSVSVASFADATYQGEGFGTVAVSQFTEVSGDAEVATFTTTLGEKTYTASLAASANGGAFSAQTLTFTATDGSGSSFAVGIAASGTIGTLNNSTTAASIATNINAGLANVDIYQTRTISSVDTTKIANTTLEGLTATSVTVKGNTFNTSATAATFGDIGKFTGVAGADSANSLSVKVNGVTFSATDIGGANDTLSSSDATITLIGKDAAGVDNNQRLIINISTLANSIDLTNQDGVNALAKSLSDLVGSSSTGGLSFQVGSTVSDKIDVSVASVATSAIYLNDAGATTALSIGTAEGAQTAAAVLDNAINSIVARRADVGSLQSRFNFASANLQTSIANQDAARGSFLDADISSESTLFANAQVKLQASVSVLAQANQLPQNLLKLLQ